MGESLKGDVLILALNGESFFLVPGPLNQKVLFSSGLST